MNYRYKHTGKVNKSGTKLQFHNQSLFDRQVMWLADKEFELIIRETRKPANSRQFRFYCGVVLKEAHKHEQFIHYNQSIDVHEKVLASMFLTDYKTVDGIPQKCVRKLEELNEQEMWDLTERVIAYLSCEFGITIADKEKYHIG